MEESISPMPPISKREFLRTGCLAVGGAFAGICRLESIGEALTSLPVPVQDALWKWSKEAEFVEPAGNALRCLKCPNGCILSRGTVGRCRNRVNINGKLYSIAYGNPCAVHVDPIEKKPFYHFLPSTRAFSIAAAGCNLRCLNCQNWQISQVSPKETDNYDLFPEAVVDRCIDAGCASIAYTYSEPTTFYEYAFDTARIARERKVRNLWKSNGYINEAPLRRLCKVIDAVNIDLKGFDEEVYAKLNGGSLQPVLRTLRVLREEGVWLEITNLVIPTWTDDLGTIAKMCEWLVSTGLQDCPLHLSRFTPLYKLTQLPPTPVAVLEKAREIALKAGMRYVYIGNVPGHPAESTGCHGCGRTVIERKGLVITRNALRNGKCEACGTAIPGVWS